MTQKRSSSAKASRSKVLPRTQKKSASTGRNASSPQKGSAKAGSSADHALKRIPGNVKKVLGDIQAQIQAGAVELSDWRNFGLGILKRLGKVSQSVRRSKAPAAAPSKKTNAQRPWTK